MKITKDTQLVWNLQNGSTIIGTNKRGYFVRIPYSRNLAQTCRTNGKSSYIVEYTKDEMIEVFGLTEDQFDNIDNSGI